MPTLADRSSTFSSWLRLYDNHKNVQKVDLFTRLIADKAVSDDYAQPIEKISDKCSIVRIQCGGRKYMRKELLWPHLDEYIDKTIKYIKRQKRIPDIVHGHYPDAGFVASQLAEIFGIPLVYTGHSLGRSKTRPSIKRGHVGKGDYQKIQDRPPHPNGRRHIEEGRSGGDQYHSGNQWAV